MRVARVCLSVVGQQLPVRSSTSWHRRYHRPLSLVNRIHVRPDQVRRAAAVVVVSSSGGAVHVIRSAVHWCFAPFCHRRSCARRSESAQRRRCGRSLFDRRPTLLTRLLAACQGSIRLARGQRLDRGPCGERRASSDARFRVDGVRSKSRTTQTCSCIRYRRRRTKRSGVVAGSAQRRARRTVLPVRSTIAAPVQSVSQWAGVWRCVRRRAFVSSRRHAVRSFPAQTALPSSTANFGSPQPSAGRRLRRL